MNPQVSVNLLLLLVVSLRTSAFNVDTTEPIVLQFDPEYVSVHQVELQTHNNSAARLFVELTNLNRSLLGMPLKFHVKIYPSSYKSVEHFSPKSGLNFSEWSILVNTRSIVTSLHQLFVRVYENNEDAEEEYPAWMTGNRESLDKSLGQTFCGADFNNDGVKDLVVGEAQSFQLNSSAQGRVTVYIRREQDSFDPDVLNGSGFIRARFGESVPCIGDIDLDGFQDLAVGAPGEDSGRGAIYIYHGSETGIKQDYSQRISAVDLYGGVHIRGFGVAISKAVDIDGNNYGDLAVGAALSSHVVLLRSRPVIRLQSSFDPTVDKVYVNGTSLEVAYCANYTGKYVPNSIGAVLKLEGFASSSTNNLQDTPSAMRRHLLRFHKYRRLYKNDIKCGNLTMSFKELPKSINGVSDPVILRLESTSMVRSSRGEFSRWSPVLDPEQSTVSLATMYIRCRYGSCHGYFNKTLSAARFESGKAANFSARVETTPTQATGVFVLVLYVVGGVFCFLMAAVVILGLFIYYRKKKKKKFKRRNVLLPPYIPQFRPVGLQLSAIFYETPLTVRQHDNIEQPQLQIRNTRHSFD